VQLATDAVFDGELGEASVEPAAPQIVHPRVAIGAGVVGKVRIDGGVGCLGALNPGAAASRFCARRCAPRTARRREVQ
jgi:hypothetical protein